MRKEWNVQIDEQMYKVDLKGAKLTVNGEELRLKDYQKSSGLIQVEYEIPIGSKQAILILKSVGEPVLAIDNKNCATGEEFTPIELPKWAYVFIALHCFNFLNGAVGIVLAAVGIVLAVIIACNTKMSIAVKVLLELAVFILALLGIIGIALLIRGF